MRKYNTNMIERGKWIDFDDEVSLKIRPFPVSDAYASHTKAENDNDDFVEKIFHKFNYSLLDWRGIQNDKGEDLPCDDINKRMVYDYDPELVVFVSNHINDLSIQETIELKNSKSSQPGSKSKAKRK